MTENRRHRGPRQLDVAFAHGTGFLAGVREPSVQTRPAEYVPARSDDGFGGVFQANPARDRGRLGARAPRPSGCWGIAHATATTTGHRVCFVADVHGEV